MSAGRARALEKEEETGEQGDQTGGGKHAKQASAFGVPSLTGARVRARARAELQPHFHGPRRPLFPLPIVGLLLVRPLLPSSHSTGFGLECPTWSGDLPEQGIDSSSGKP